MPDISTPCADTSSEMEQGNASIPDIDLTVGKSTKKFESDITEAKVPVVEMTKAEIRKENHNKVERKRREAINQAMDDLSALLPGNEKSKSRVLGRAVEYIKLLMKENTGLRQQVEQHCEANHQYQIEIASLKAQLNIQAQ